MIEGLNKKTFLVLGLGVLLLIAISASFADRNIGIALLSGYVLFSVNYVLFARIYAGLFQISQMGVASPSMKRWLMFGTALKFVGLIGALYALIVLWKLPGLYIAVGSLVSLFLLTSLLVLSYLKSFGTPNAGK